MCNNYTLIINNTFEKCENCPKKKNRLFKFLQISMFLISYSNITVFIDLEELLGFNSKSNIATNLSTDLMLQEKQSR